MGITGPLEDTPTEEMKRVFDTNFFGPIEVMKAVLPSMRKEGRGLIINITSIAGYMGLPVQGHIFSATKGALELITESARMELKGFGIEVTNIAPGRLCHQHRSWALPRPASSRHSAVPGEFTRKAWILWTSHVDQGGESDENGEGRYTR